MAATADQEHRTDAQSATMKSKWPEALDLAGSDLPCRLEGEIADVVVLGEIPKEIDGTFYRVMTDPCVPPHPGNVPLDGDGNISAFRFENGRVDMKMRYVETERYMLERKANKALFGLYRNPFSHHPCVRAAVDSTANTNLVLWADRFMALKEGGLPYQVDPHSLATLGYDPFDLKGLSKTFTAHPKVDPYTGELVVFGYEAKGLASPDIFIFTLDADGVRHDEQWVRSPWVAPIHDCAITLNWLILCLWPFEARVERMNLLCRWEQEVWLRSEGLAGMEDPRRHRNGPRHSPQYRLNRRQYWQNAPPETMEKIQAYIDASPVTPDAIRAAMWACRRFLPILTIEGFLKAAEAFTDDPSLAQLYKAKNREARETWLRKKAFIKTPQPPPQPPSAASKRPAARESDGGDEADDEGVVARKRIKV